MKTIFALLLLLSGLSGCDSMARHLAARSHELLAKPVEPSEPVVVLESSYHEREDSDGWDVIHVRVKNISDKKCSFVAVYFNVIDKEGYRLSSPVSASTQTILPGEEVKLKKVLAGEDDAVSVSLDHIAVDGPCGK